MNVFSYVLTNIHILPMNPLQNIDMLKLTPLTLSSQEQAKVCLKLSILLDMVLQNKYFYIIIISNFLMFYPWAKIV